jgi:tRNA nucleotidyltransferase (CCA-adding enzyme)
MNWGSSAKSLNPRLPIRSAMNEELKVYLVGGVVRDALIAEQVADLKVRATASDRDWVVVGSTPQQLLDLGYLPVGKDFPVFLHPDSKEEYALARTERKQGAGHKGFSIDANPSVTLHEDLSRRDLTINAIAQDSNGHLIDPHQGQADIAAGLLRHVSDAFTEDPLRVFRVARFAAQLSGFKVADETQVLLMRMCSDRDLETLSAERVWQEFAKALAAPNPGRFFEVLEACGGLTYWLPECAGLSLGSIPMHHSDPAARFALLPISAKGLAAILARLRGPNRYAQLAADRHAHLSMLEQWPMVEPKEFHRMLDQLRVIHAEERLQQLVDLIPATAIRQRLMAELPALVAQLRQISLSAEEAKALHGAAYGARLTERRQAHLAHYLLDKQK